MSAHLQRFILTLFTMLLFAESRAAIVLVSIPLAEQEFLALGDVRHHEFDFNRDGRNDIRFSAGAGGFVVTALHYEAGIIVADLVGMNFSGTTAVPLPYGEVIEEYTEGPGIIPRGIDPGGQGRVYLLAYGALDGSAGGLWYDQEAYMGFSTRVVVPGEFDTNYFGWLRIRCLGGFGGYFLEYAYETEPNVPILAGQIPEPSTAALLAVFAIWPVFRRHRTTREM